MKANLIERKMLDMHHITQLYKVRLQYLTCELGYVIKQRQC